MPHEGTPDFKSGAYDQFRHPGRGHRSPARGRYSPGRNLNEDGIFAGALP